LNINHYFNKASATYDSVCHLQKTTGRRLLSLIKEIRENFPHIIDLGCGTGLVTEQISTTFSHQALHAIDSANQLLEIANARLQQPNTLVYEADFEQPLEPTILFDLVFSNLALHWAKDINHVFNHISKFTNAEGILAFSIPLQGTFCEFPPTLAKRDFALPATIQHYLLLNHFEMRYCTTEPLIFSFDSPIQALKSIKQVGANGASKYHKGLRGKNFLKQMTMRELTYVIGYFIAQRKTSL
jgi:malonyl-CoA O-methyltransferase